MEYTLMRWAMMQLNRENIHTFEIMVCVYICYFFYQVTVWCIIYWMQVSEWKLYIYIKDLQMR